ncbi:MAG TPA: flagellin [Coriobacteriia bacterium]|nr:flagellin [Coriobacteriia bacterium]
MSLRIQNNIEALGAHRSLVNTSSALQKSMERLSTGYRINRAADDAAGLGISEKMRGQIRGLAQSQSNISGGVSLVQVAEANLDEVHKMLQRTRELAVQYNNGTLSAANKLAIQSEVNQLASEVERIGTAAAFNGIKLLDGTQANVTFQVGADDGQVIAVALVSLGTSVPVTTFSLADTASIANIDAAIDSVSAQRATFGAVQNRLEYANSAAGSYQENLVAAESRIRDVDMAQEMINFTKNQILSQAGMSMLSQANQSGQGVLSLLQ